MATTPRESLPEISALTKSTWQRKRRDHSAGGVAFRRAPAGEGEAGEFEIALIATRGGKRWQLPKGSREGDERSEQTAVREVEEEVGLRTEVVEFLSSIDYWYWDTYRKDVPELVHKTVDFFLLRVVGGALNDACYEVDAVGWFSFDAAVRIMTFSGELEVVRLARERLNAGADAGTA
jgi:8-oxo-dGTP pyrophosphatase MutT (NUDIX family)